jgi:biopolymer transport protein TolR
MRRPLAGNAPTMTRINVTPIIDVALVLVIILLITAPILSVTDLQVDVPQARTRGREDESRIMITLGKRGDLAIDDKVVVNAHFDRALEARLRSVGDEVLVVVRADTEMPYDDVSAVLRRARDAGATRLAIATRQKGDAKR